MRRVKGGKVGAFGPQWEEPSPTGERSSSERLVAKGVPPLRPGPPGGDVDGDHRTWRRLSHVLFILGAKLIKRQLAPATRFDHPGAPIDTDPPKGRPVLAVVVDQQGHRRGHPHVLEPAQRQGRLWLGVDCRVDELTLNREATGHDVRPSVWTDGG